MARWTRYLTALCLGLALHFLGSSALAQQAAQPAQPLPRSNSAVASTVPSSNAAVVPQKLYRFNVRVRTPGRRLSIRTSDDVTVARCIGSCSLNLPKGEYLASLLDDAGEQSPGVDFEVNGPGGIELEDTDAETAATGLGFGLAGLALATGGFALMTVGMSHACLIDGCEDEEAARRATRMMLGGLGAIVVGGIMAPIGFVTWSRNRHPRLHADPTAYSVAVVPTRDGAFLGITGGF